MRMLRAVPGLSVRAWREFIKVGAVRTIAERQGPGRVRRCDSTTLKRAAAIGALSQAGPSLFVSGQIAYFMPLHTILNEICDPCRILLERSAEVDPLTGLPPRVERPRVSWFDPDKPTIIDPNAVEIYEARFVGVKYSVKGAPTIFGDPREAGTSFVAWFPNEAANPIQWRHHCRTRGRAPASRCQVDRRRRRLATTINVKIRKTLRRYLGIEPVGPGK